MKLSSVKSLKIQNPPATIICFSLTFVFRPSADKNLFSYKTSIKIGLFADLNTHLHLSFSLQGLGRRGREGDGSFPNGENKVGEVRLLKKGVKWMKLSKSKEISSRR